MNLTYIKHRKSTFGIYSWESENWKNGSVYCCPMPCDPMDYNLPGSSVHGILNTRILECVAIPFSRVSSQPKDWTCVSYIPGRFFTVWTTREAEIIPNVHANCAELCFVTQLCLTLSDPMDCSLPGSSVYGNSPCKNTGMGCHALLQGIFSTQESNWGLPHCGWIL